MSLQVRLLLQDREELHVEVDHELELVKTLHDVQNCLLLLLRHIHLIDTLHPLVAVVRNEFIKLSLKGDGFRSEVLTAVLLEVLPEDLLDTLLIDNDLLLDL